MCAVPNMIFGYFLDVVLYMYVAQVTEESKYQLDDTLYFIVYPIG